MIGPETDVVKDGGGPSAIDEFSTTRPPAALRNRLGVSRVVNDDGPDAAPRRPVAAARPRTVAVLQSGGPVLTLWRSNARHTVQAEWTPARGGGAMSIADDYALAAVLAASIADSKSGLAPS